MRSAVTRYSVVLFVGVSLSCFAAIPKQGRGGAPQPEAGRDSPGIELHSPELDEIAQKPWRPQWAPLPAMHGEVRAVPWLHGLLESDTPVFRARAAFLLGRIRCPDSVPKLVALLDDVERDVRVHAGLALASMADSRGKHVCAAALDGEPAWIRYYAILGLWRIAGTCEDSADYARSVLKNARAGGSPIVEVALEGALSTPYVPLPQVGPALKDAEGPIPPPQQIWEQAGDALVVESDWWWHHGNYDQAIRCSEASMFLDPDYVETYTVVAWLQWSMGRDAEAIGTLHRAVEAAPADPASHFGLGQHYWNTKRYALAEEPLRRAVELGGDHLARRIYAHTLEALGKTSEALTQWEELLKLRPKDGAVRLNYNRVRELVGEE